MKERISVAALLLFGISLFSMSAQDIILKRNGDEIEAKVEEITQTEVYYHLWNNQNGPLRKTNKSNIFRIKFANGDVEVFENADKNVAGYAYRVGDIYNENGLRGVVVHTTDNDYHGLIMSIQRLTRPMQDCWWCTRELSKYVTGATDELDGENNMTAIEHFIEENGLSWEDFPAFNWCRQLGEGWYIPSIMEVEYIVKAVTHNHLDDDVYTYVKKFNKKIAEISGEKNFFTGYTVMSSTETKESSASAMAYVYKVIPFVGSFYEKGAIKKATSPNPGSWSVVAVHKF